MNCIRRWTGIDEPAMAAVAVELGAAVRNGGVIFLRGDLGAGKTTFARALLRALGVGERIKSPTYSLIESHSAGGLDIHHLDLYRIAAADELEWLGLGDLLTADALLLIEWPERGEGALPSADLCIDLAHAGNLRDLGIEACTDRGEGWLARLP